jgi:hypothetical protein
MYHRGIPDYGHLSQGAALQVTAFEELTRSPLNYTNHKLLQYGKFISTPANFSNPAHDVIAVKGLGVLHGNGRKDRTLLQITEIKGNGRGAQIHGYSGNHTVWVFLGKTSGKGPRQCGRRFTDDMCRHERRLRDADGHILLHSAGACLGRGKTAAWINDFDQTLSANAFAATICAQKNTVLHQRFHEVSVFFRLQFTPVGQHFNSAKTLLHDFHFSSLIFFISQRSLFEQI